MGPLLELAELLCLVARSLRVDEFVEEPVPEAGAPVDQGGAGERRPEVGHICPRSHIDPVVVGVLGLHHHVGVQEVRGRHVGAEGRVALLEHHRDYVVPDVALPLQLLGVGLLQGEQHVHVVHALLALVLGVNAVLSGLPELGVQPAPVASTTRCPTMSRNWSMMGECALLLLL